MSHDRKGELSTKTKKEYRLLCGERDGWFCKSCGVPLIPEGTPSSDEKYFERTGPGGLWNCVRKGFETPTLDHIIPLSRKNVKDISNFQLLCHNCNSRRRNKDWDKFMEEQQ